jgi:hypothetical protein
MFKFVLKRILKRIEGKKDLSIERVRKFNGF